MDDDIIEIKPGIGGLAVNLRAAWRRLRRGCQATPGRDVALRFLSLFGDHGIPNGCIPSLIAGLSYRAVESPDALLAELHREHLVAASGLLGVELAWLEGVQPKLYGPRYCYKSPEHFFQALDAFSVSDMLPLRALATTRGLDRTSGQLQRLALVLVESVPTAGEPQIERYVPFMDAWDWSHTPCRLQLKAMVRAYGRPVPIHEVDAAVIEGITAGQRVPREASQPSLITDP